MSANHIKTFLVIVEKVSLVLRGDRLMTEEH